MQLNDPWETLSPHLKECLNEGIPDEFVAEFCEVDERTVGRWFKQGGPRGIRLVKAWCLVQETGAELPVIAEESDIIRMVFELLGHGIITLEDAMDIFKVSNSQGVYRIFRAGVALKTTYALEELEELYMADLEAAKANLAEEIERVKAGPFEEELVDELEHPVEATYEVEHDGVDEPVVEAEPVFRPLVADSVLLPLATGLSATIPLVRSLETEEFLAFVRIRLEDLVGEDGMDELSKLFVPPSSKQPLASCYVSDDSSIVEHLAALLREAAPHIHALYDDDTPTGARNREQLRATVGAEAYSVLSVQLNAMRSRQAYEKAQKGDIN